MKNCSDKRRTIDAFPSYSAMREPGFYTHMFVQDIEVGLMGFRYSEGEHERQIKVDGDGAGIASLKTICKSISHDSRYEVADSVKSVIESIGARLAWFGEAVYEICGHGPDKTVASVVPFRLFRVPGGFVQIVPKADREWLEGRRFVFLPSHCAWVVDVPPCAGGPKAHRRLLTHLTAVSRPAPDFWTEELKAGKIVTVFNLSDYNRRRSAYVARQTRRWGWNRRDSSGTYDTEFFYFFRSLRFRKYQAVLRDHIVAELNRFLTREGINVRIRLEGFRSPAEIDDLIGRALDGSLHYAEALKQAR
jgi:hypothetical protein